MNAVDTNVLVRLCARDEPDQLRRAGEFVQSGAWVSLLVLGETIWVLSRVYRKLPDALAATIEMILQHPHLVLQSPEIVAAALAEFRRRPHLGFMDCIILEQARAGGHLPLGTFDRELGKAPGAVLLR